MIVKNQTDGLVTIIYFVGLAFVFGFLMGGLTGEAMMKNVAVEQQCAHYDSQTGNFVWNNTKPSE